MGEPAAGGFLEVEARPGGLLVAWAVRGAAARVAVRAAPAAPDDTVSDAGPASRGVGPPASVGVVTADGAAALLLDAGGGLVLDGREVARVAAPSSHRRDVEPVTAVAPAELAQARARLRDHAAGACHHGPTGTAAAAVALVAADAVMLEVCLGPPCCGVFLRCWPGIEVGPDVAGGAGGMARLGALAGRIAAAVDGREDRLRSVRAVLDTAEAGALAEGGDAERMARIMDAAGDDRGGEVRRTVGHAHAVALAVEGLERAATLVTTAGPSAGASL